MQLGDKLTITLIRVLRKDVVEHFYVGSDPNILSSEN
jgi:hypothetical protein